MVPTIVPVYAALLAVGYFLLALRVIRARYRAGVAIGTGGDPRLERAVRVHGNFAEYVPLALILLAFVEASGRPAWLVHLLALALVAGRLVHAVTVSRENENPRLRLVGMFFTFSVLLASAAVLLTGALFPG